MRSRILAAAFALLVFADPSIASTETSTRVLICLDGVPHALMRQAAEEGLFASFGEPARLVSTFPAITEVMLTECFGTEPPPGYGLRYYDKAENQLKGGIMAAEAISIWFSVYDYVTPMVDRGVVYLWGRWAHSDLARVKRRLARIDSGVLLMHLDSSDALMHHEKPAATRTWLRDLSGILEAWIAKRRAAGEDVEVVLFSDHGNDMTPCRRIPIEEHLVRAGFRPSSTIRDDSGVAILPTGLISVGYLYTHRETEVVEALRSLRGVDLVVNASESRVWVTSAGGRAVIDRREPDAGSGEAAYRYTPLEGDPLRLDSIVADFRNRGALDAEGFAADRAWFAATLEHFYPDVLNRAWGGLTGHVANVGDVLVSLRPGWQCGSRALGMLVRFQGTHGALDSGSITGFAASSRRDLPPMRAEELLDRLGWRARIAEKLLARGVTIRRGVAPESVSSAAMEPRDEPSTEQ